jgi:hypothetical protein
VNVPSIVVHRARKSWNAYAPDLDGIVATTATRERPFELITQAIPCHLERIAASEACEPYVLTAFLGTTRTPG